MFKLILKTIFNKDEIIHMRVTDILVSNTANEKNEFSNWVHVVHSMLLDVCMPGILLVLLSRGECSHSLDNATRLLHLV